MKQNKKTLKKHADYRLARLENKVLIEFAKRMNVTPMEIIQHNKSTSISDIRHLYCKLRHENHGVNYSATGRELDRSHTAVIYAVMHINDLLLMKDKRIAEMWKRVKNIPGYEGELIEK
jgi:chromosomal replication initiation ATPase DnaA